MENEAQQPDDIRAIIREKLQSFENRLMGRLDAQDAMIGVLIRQKMSNKQEKLADEVSKLGRMYTKQVRNFLGCSRPHALNLMEKLGTQAGFRYVKGDQKTKRAGVIIYSASFAIQDQHTKLKRLLTEKESVTYHDIMAAFDVPIHGAKDIAAIFVESVQGFKIDGNRIVSISTVNKSINI
ncbi:hypothetical protein HYV81_04735 [Candidatus Woesearchaeota archaeon]|nr:hypothetical protein [Candidatus Woesearchaeota archaeon]